MLEHLLGLSIKNIKKLGSTRCESSLDALLEMYLFEMPVELKREVVSSIGRQRDKDRVYNFIKDNVFNCNCMELVYQMYRTCLYNLSDKRFFDLSEEIFSFYNNEMLFRMKTFFEERKRKAKAPKKLVKQILKPTLLKGDNVETLKKVGDGQVQLIFTSPPYYNAREYSDYTSYKDYLQKMYNTLVQCHRVLEDGRFIIINVSPVITKRPGREFESIRYPIHFDFHNILTRANFYFIDEIIWIKPEYTCPNRNGGYQQTKMPLSYKPNCITESLLIYRKDAPFLIDKNIGKYDGSYANVDEKIDFTNCWRINPKSDRNHPAVFPEELCEKVLKYYSFRGDVVLDPFAGSGAFGRVAKKMLRTPILCESSEDYITLLERQGYEFF
ncbi:MAG: site-specific DNA-methyltransferase [Deferribacteraceae bacterium]|jgi:DNA modification methylase|nr:site-specific DNA-methyltransferase [Deferribacteraceae bacterium]